NSWTMEIAIPLSQLKIDPQEGFSWGGQIVRNRYKNGEKKAYQWSPTFWYSDKMPTFYGQMTLSE
ncbi:MAG: hypothetical protein AAF226_01170, partial [Verrucomicrobiota bacterium]